MFRRLTNHPLAQRFPVVRQFTKFALVGTLNTLIDYAVFAGLVFAVNIHYLVANVISFSLAATNSYLLNRRWTFRSRNPAWRREAAKFFVVIVLGLGLNEAILFLLVDFGHIHKLLAKAVGIAVVLFWNFLGTRLWAFRQASASLPG